MVYMRGAIQIQTYTNDTRFETGTMPRCRFSGHAAAVTKQLRIIPRGPQRRARQGGQLGPQGSGPELERSTLTSDYLR